MSTQRWVEKYRPDTRKGIVGQPCVEKMNITPGVLPQHALLAGPSGTGKTTAGRAVAKEVFGHTREGWKAHYEEFNASDVSGIDFVRTHLTRLFRMSHPKIILLDEADRISTDAQEALRNLMESSNTTCIWFTANKPWKIEKAIASRCVPYAFKRIEDSVILGRLIYILNAEGVTFDFGNGDTQDAEIVRYIIDKSAGDLRKSINVLESVVDDGKINPDLLEKGASSDFLVQALETAIKGDLEKSKRLLEDAIVVDALNTDDVIYRARDFIHTLDNTWLRLELTVKLSETAYRLSFGNHLVHYEGFLSHAMILMSTQGGK